MSDKVEESDCLQVVLADCLQSFLTYQELACNEMDALEVLINSLENVRPKPFQSFISGSDEGLEAFLDNEDNKISKLIAKHKEAVKDIKEATYLVTESCDNIDRKLDEAEIALKTRIKAIKEARAIEKRLNQNNQN